MQPRQRLTAREAEVATPVWQGLTNRDIAALIGTTEQVVKNYLRKVYDKLGVADRLELALYCLNNRVVLDVKQAAPAQTAQGSEPAKDQALQPTAEEVKKPS